MVPHAERLPRVDDHEDFEDAADQGDVGCRGVVLVVAEIVTLGNSLEVCWVGYYAFDVFPHDITQIAGPA